MKLRDISITEAAITSLYDTIARQCKSSISAYNSFQKTLYHGTVSNKNFVDAFPIRKDRKPVDTNETFNTIFNLVMEYKFQIPLIRTKVKFVTNDIDSALKYSNHQLTSVFVPLIPDDAYMIFSPNITDSLSLTHDIEQMLNKLELVYGSENLNALLELRTLSDFNERNFIDFTRSDLDTFLRRIHDTIGFDRYGMKRVSSSTFSEVLNTSKEIEIMVYGVPQFYGVKVMSWDNVVKSLI